MQTNVLSRRSLKVVIAFDKGLIDALSSAFHLTFAHVWMHTRADESEDEGKEPTFSSSGPIEPNHQSTCWLAHRLSHFKQ